MLKPQYDAVIIGSGYGGAIAASRLARARRPDGTELSVCLLERGNEIPTGEFPDSEIEAFAQCTLDTPGHPRGDRTGLYHFHFDPEVTVIQGCGLGGTSLINANVSLEPDKQVFQGERWPRAIREDGGGRLAAGFAQARAMLKPVAYPEPEHGTPDGWNGKLSKYDVLKAAAGPGARVYRAPININLKDGFNHVGVHQPSCSGCGDCMSGCNVGAKNTLTKNYLPDARNRGAEMFCGIEVRAIARQGDAWAVYYVPMGHHRGIYDAPELFVRAQLVVLSAGTLGSTEILLRSKQRGLPCSDFVGHQFSGNGDFMGFAYNGDARVNGVGRGKANRPNNQPGPTITGVIDLRDTKPYTEGFIVEEGAIPSALKEVLPLVFQVGRNVLATDPDHSLWHRARQWGREVTSVATAAFGGAYRGAIANTQTFLTMSFDEDKGSLALENDRLRIHWRDAAGQPGWQRIENKFRELATASGATYVPSPLFTKFFKFDVLTAHPLGGCICGDDAATGVVNERAQLFRVAAGDDAYPDLYVMDGSIVPSPLGVNPLLTISALSERAVRLLIEDHGWTLDETMPTGPAKFDGVRETSRPITLQFCERMLGYLTPSTDDFAAAADAARGLGHTATAVYGIMSPDLDAMIADPERTAKLTGTVQIPALSPDPMTIFDGTFNLFVNVNGKMHKQMRYRMKLSASDGAQYYFDGKKEVHDDRGIDVHSDTTQLFSTVHAGGPDGPIVAKGVLKIDAEDVLRLVRTMSARDRNGKSSLIDCVRFGKLFVGDLWDVYGLEAKLERL
ncbi:MAG TPA: GMC family oxidoreductase N-terminal domain-containing protein [Kofleriaceae bacterium]|nr:GMC family oxidoreductase N-terminal domain-containing protein [Kofleriaceae bacterium]